MRADSQPKSCQHPESRRTKDLSSAAAGDGEVVHGGTQACNVGISLGFSRSWGTGDTRSRITVPPVDDETSDIRSTSWLERLPDDREPGIPHKLTRRVKIANNQFLADVNIWEHQRYTEPPGLATAEAKRFRMVRRFYPEGERGSGPAEQDAGVEAGRPEEAFNAAAGGD